MNIRRVLAASSIAVITLLASGAQADAPPVSCQADAPRHTKTLGPSGTEYNAVQTFTSTHKYWDNACGCYIAQVEVPYNAASGIYMSVFGFVVEAATLPTTKAECETYKAHAWVYKKDGTNWTLLYGGALSPYWSSSHCYTGGVPGAATLTAPSTGTDKYRVLARASVGGKHVAVTMRASLMKPPQ